MPVYHRETRKPVSSLQNLDPRPAYCLHFQQARPQQCSIVSDSSSSTDHYPDAYKDFFGYPAELPASTSGVLLGLNPKVHYCASRATSGRRALSTAPIAGSWLKICTEIYEFLDSCSIKWTSIDPVAFANPGMSCKKTGECRKEIVALCNMGYKNATNAIMARIGKLARSVAV